MAPLSSQLAGSALRLYGVLNHDFCPWANRWVYWLKNPFWILLAGAITSVVCGLFVSTTVLVLGAGLAMVLALGVVWPRVSLRGISGSIRFGQTRGRVEDPITLEIDIRNCWPWPVWGLELSRGLFDESSARQGIALAVVAGWSETRWKWTFRPECRGVFPLSQPQFECGFPFGLYRASRPAGMGNQLVVWPQSTMLGVLPDAAEIEAREDRTSDRRAGDVGDVLGTRWFRQGDSLRRVHWAQSARQGRLIVCERQIPVSCALRVVLDLDPAHHGPPSSDGSLERLLSVAASLVESLHANHAYVECVMGHELYSVGSAPQELRGCLDALARIPATGQADCSSHGLCCGSARRHRAMPEFVLTTPKGFAVLQHSRHWSENHHYIVVGAKGAEAPRECTSHEHCGCRPWLELPADDDVLVSLQRLWRRACRAA